MKGLRFMEAGWGAGPGVPEGAVIGDPAIEYSCSLRGR